MLRKTMSIIFLLVLVSFFQGCGPSRTVTRIGTDEVVDLSGRWNDTDSRLTAEQMIKGLLERPWDDEFQTTNGRKPAVIVGTVRNLSSEHIETGIFIKDIERELVNCGRVKFVATKEERVEIRDERTDQQSFATEETAKGLANETGADFMLKGSIKSQTDAVDGQEIKYYQVDLELINLENNEKVWIDSKKIKKNVEKSSSSW
ncbi:MAG: penicillin-binding protein activator LpoB [bacterium]